MPEWHEHSDESLIDYAAGHLQQAAPAAMEMQRRLMVATKEFSATSTRQSRTLIRLTWAIIGLTVALGVLGAFQIWASVRASQPESPVAAQWRGFYYADVGAMRGAAIGAERLAGAPSFKDLQACVDWGRRAVVGSASAGFECSLGCRFEQAMGEVVCRDSTRMMR